MKRTALWWIRRDCRREDSQALQAALAAGETLVPVFILDSALLPSRYMGDKRTAFLLGGMPELDEGLCQQGSYLVVRQEQLKELTTLARESKAGRILTERDLSPDARQEDTGIGDRLPLDLSDSVSLHHPDLAHKADGLPYIVYTLFKRRWLRLAVPNPQSLIPAPGHIPTPSSINSVPIPDRPIFAVIVPFQLGEEEAQRRFVAFVRWPISRYGARRDRVDHATNRRATLDAYALARERYSNGGKEYDK